MCQMPADAGAARLCSGKPKAVLVYRNRYMFTIYWDVVHYKHVESSTAIGYDA
jgi:hypothetical protein